MFLIALLVLTILNSFFFLIPYLMPRINQMEIYMYQIFSNALLLLYLLLPKKTGDFDWDKLSNEKPTSSESHS